MRFLSAFAFATVLSSGALSLSVAGCGDDDSGTLGAGASTTTATTTSSSGSGGSCDVQGSTPSCEGGPTLTYPPAVSLSSVQYPTYLEPGGAVAEYLVPFSEPLNNNRVIRISDKTVFGTTGGPLRHNYAKDQPWNADGTLIKLAGYPAAIIDAKTYELTGWSDIPSYGRWSNTKPNLMYGTPGNRFVVHDVTTNATSTLHTFDGYASIDFGYGEGNQSDDDRYVGLIGENGNDRTLIVYDLQNDLVVGTDDLGSAGDLDWFAVSPKGTSAVASWRVDGAGATEGSKVYDIDLTNKRHLANTTEHADLGIDAAGDEVLVSFGGQAIWDQDHYLEMVRLSDGLSTPLFSYPGGIWGGHISTRNNNRPGWAYVSENCCADNDVAAREIFAIKLDDSDTIERYVTHHTNPAVGNGGHSATAVVNRDGTKVLFASNWSNSSLESDENPPAWVVEVPQKPSPSSIDLNVSDDLTVCPGATVTLYACGAASYQWSGGEVSATINVQPSKTTTYSVVGTSGDGNAQASAEIVVTVDAAANCTCQ